MTEAEAQLSHALLLFACSFVDHVASRSLSFFLCTKNRILLLGQR